MKNLIINKHSRTHKKALGAYYTPTNLSKVLCEWALRSPYDTALEPSFGGCGFLEASIKRLSELGSINAISQLYGADIDPTAFDFLSKKIGKQEGILRQFLFNDFLQVEPNDYGGVAFDVVLGNPPYVSLHNMSKNQKVSCFKLLKNSAFAKGTIGRNASLWAFFLLHSLSFIKPGGRSAWVLPSSLLHADYANEVLKVFSRHFSLVKVVKLSERFFQNEEADEISVILFADGFSKEKKSAVNIGFTSVYGAEELEQLCGDRGLSSVKNNNYKHTLISKKALSEFNKIAASKNTILLGNSAKIIIGMVTGDNKSFVIDKQTVNKYNIQDDDLKPVIGRFSILNGLIHTNSRHKKAQIENKKAYLICPQNINIKKSNIRNYLSRIPRSNRKDNRTFAKRSAWFYPDDGKYPDAFLTYMIHKIPRIVINQSKINCTNSIHRVFFNKNVKARERKAIAISMLSSYSQLSAELEGRAYGSGVLKLEPSAAKKIQIIITPKLIDIFNEKASLVDKILKDELFEVAQKIIDELIAEEIGISIDIMKTFSLAVEELRNGRYMGLTKKLI